MIVSVATFSLGQARKYLGRRYHHGHSHSLDQRRVWVGFDTCVDDQSPLRYSRDGGRESLVIRCHDWDEDGRHAPAFVGPVKCAGAPTIEHARQIVEFVLAARAAPESFDLCVHCHAGLFRSGAVAEWVRVDLGVPEHEASNRLVGVLGEREDSRTFNNALLRLIRQAHAEAVAQSERAAKP